jgi:peptide/nickel transport system substrate-binding protein
MLRRMASIGGAFSNPEYDAMITKMTNTFDQVEQDKLLAQLHTRVVDDSLVLWICHDVNPAR